MGHDQDLGSWMSVDPCRLTMSSDEGLVMRVLYLGSRSVGSGSQGQGLRVRVSGSGSRDGVQDEGPDLGVGPGSRIPGSRGPTHRPIDRPIDPSIDPWIDPSTHRSTHGSTHIWGLGGPEMALK